MVYTNAHTDVCMKVAQYIDEEEEEEDSSTALLKVNTKYLNSHANFNTSY
jgi:hypothetical protein